MNYSTIKELRTLHITAAEVGEIAKVRQSGLTDADCVTLLQIFHGRGEAFTAGDAIASLHQSGLSEGSVLALAGMDQVGLGYGELQAMHLAGLSDAIVLEVARHHASGTPALSGASLGTLRNCGLITPLCWSWCAAEFLIPKRPKSSRCAAMVPRMLRFCGALRRPRVRPYRA